jgi:hypothetical protein
MTTDTIATQDERLWATVRWAADWLHLAAAPTFAVMAVLSGAFGGSPGMLCASLYHASPLSGMTAMYALMSAFHVAPWLRLIASRAGRS